MSNYYIFKEDNISPCCNLIIWDFFITVATISFSCQNWFSTTLTGFQQFFIGLLGGLLLISLMAIHFIRKIIMILFSIFWSLGIYELLDEFFQFSNYSAPWRYGICIFIFLMAFAIHAVSAEDLGMLSLDPPQFHKNNSSHKTSNAGSHITSVAQEDLHQCEELFNEAIRLADFVQALPNTTEVLPLKNFVKNNTSELVKQYHHLDRCINRYNKILNESSLQQLTTVMDDTSLMLEEYIYTLRTMIDENNERTSYDETEYDSHYDDRQQTQQTTYSSNVSNYFKGCDTLEKLSKRYRDLAKVYHSDSGNGNDEVFIEITDEYNRLKEILSK